MKPTNIDYSDDDTEYRDEWLSAYLDGELTEEQQLIVEQRLASDTAAQTTLTDLQRIRSLVKQLPAWTGPMAAVPPMTAMADDPSEDIESTGIGAASEEFDEPLPEPGLLAKFESQPGNGTGSVGRPGRPQDDSRSVNKRLGWLRPAAVAASLLLIVGVSYGLWQSGTLGPGLALDFSASKSATTEAPAEAGRIGSQPTEAELAAEGFPMSAAETAAMPQESESESIAAFGAAGSSALPDGMADMQSTFVAPPADSPAEALSRNSYPLPSDLPGMGAPGMAAEAMAADSPDRSLPMPKLSSPPPGRAERSAGGNLDNNSLELIEVAPATPPSSGAEQTVQELLLGHDSRWSAAMIQRELQAHAMLSAIQADGGSASLSEQFVQQVNSDSSAMTAEAAAHSGKHALAVAQLPSGGEDARALFNRLLNDYQLQPLARLTVSTAVEEDSASLSPGRSEAASPAAPSQTLMLFITRMQAEQILRQDAVRGANDTAPQYLWITPSRGAGGPPRGDDERVILMLNSPPR